MKIPDWIPKIHRPFNPAHWDTYDAMTKEERQKSFLIDVGTIAVALGVITLFSYL